MSYISRLNKAYEGALKLPLNDSSKYVLISDCHRGNGTANDNFLKNQTLYLAALRHYFQNGFTYIEAGDGDELWENRRIEQIIEIHSDVFLLLSQFFAQNRLYMLYGNHDMVKKGKTYEGLILIPCQTDSSQGYNSAQTSSAKADALPPKNIFITHGHQADLLNSTLWPLSRFLVRYLWKPLENLGIVDPTSAAKNYRRKEKTETRLQQFAKQKNHMLIAGHTHRPHLSEADSYYCNSGSCVHPYSITCLEIEHMHISLVKWNLSSDKNRRLFVNREILSGPYPCP